MSLRCTGFVLLLGLCATFAKAEVLLKQKLPEQTTQQMSVNSKVVQKLTLNGNDVPISAEEHNLLELKYGRRGDDGVLPVQCRHAACQVDVEVAGQKLHFDAANPQEGADSDSPLNMLLDGYRRIAKTPFTLHVDENLKVVDIRGWEKLLEGLDEKSAALHKDMLDPQYLRSVWSAEYDRIPTTPVKVGDVWERKQEDRFQGGQSMTFTTQYKYVGPIEKDGKQLDKIEVKTTKVKYDMAADDDAPLVVSQSNLKIASSEGQLLFDRGRGQVVYVAEKMNIQGDLKFTVTASGKELPGKLDLTIETDTLLLP